MQKNNVMLQKITLKTILIAAIFLAVFCTSACEKVDESFTVDKFSVEFVTNIDNLPAFRWKINSSKAGFVQKAYQLIVADNKPDIESGKGNVWNSGKIKTEYLQQAKYSGKKLNPGAPYYAKVRIWDTLNHISAWSKPIKFHTPISYPTDWNAKWIAHEYHADSALPIFKKQININKPENIDYARLYIAAPGFYEAFINGKKIGRNVLDPGQTNFEDYTFYTVYPIELSELKKENALSVMLGNGWYNQYVVWSKRMSYGTPVFMAQVELVYKNGSKEIIGTDESWKWKYGPIQYSNIYGGETYNANLLPRDWDTPNDSLKTWKKAIPGKKHPSMLLQQYAQPIKVMDSLEVKGVIADGEGGYILDFGQNFSGWVKLSLQGEKGQEITLQCVEELDENDKIDPRTTGIRATKVIQTQKYICKGTGVETWEPKFTYFGFRYAKVQGVKSKPTDGMFKGMVVYSSLPKVGSFTCSEENINKLHELANWTLKGNLHGIPTDCPHREKCGWTGDAHALVKALIYNYDAQQFLRKYIYDMRSSGRQNKRELYFGEHFHDRSYKIKQKGIPTMIVPGKRTSGIASPDWGTAMTQLPWQLYLHYADTTILNDFYPDMKVWVEYIHNIKEDGLIKHGLGDWCPPGGNTNRDCPVPLSSSAFHILDLAIISKVAKLLNKEDDFKRYSGLHQEAISSFNKKFLDIKAYTYGSQTGNALALDIGIVPEEYKVGVAKSIIKNMNESYNGFISTGIFGVSRLFQVLCENGLEQETYKLLTKKGNHSFAYMWDKYQATTLWEVLPIKTEEDEELRFRSHNHPMHAGYDSWFYSGIAGINPCEDYPGYKRILFKPYLTKQLKESKVALNTIAGMVVSNWRNVNGTFNWQIKVPENSKGEIYLPKFGESDLVTINGEAVNELKHEGAYYKLGLYGSGEYKLELKYKQK